jgi:DNA-binding NtrC family response regulator
MLKIVLIDDDYASEILLENLEFRGYDARRINSATAAFASMDEIVAADLVILDIIMERAKKEPTNDRRNIKTLKSLARPERGGMRPKKHR